jgi:hypothetical protein
MVIFVPYFECELFPRHGLIYVYINIFNNFDLCMIQYLIIFCRLKLQTKFFLLSSVSFLYSFSHINRIYK